MKSCADLLNDALKRMDLASDAALSRLVNVSRKTMSFWRDGKSVPEDDKLTLLADLAAWDVDEARFWATYWRADEATQKSLMKRLKVTGAIVALLCMSLPLKAVNAASYTPLQSHQECGSIYYGN